MTKYENLTSSYLCFISSANILQSRHSRSMSTVILQRNITMLLAAEDQFDRNTFHPRYIQQHFPVLHYLYSMKKIEQKQPKVVYFW